MRALTAISIIVMGAAVAACNSSGSDGSGGAGGSTVASTGGAAPGTGGETPGTGGETGTGGDIGTGGTGGVADVGTGGRGEGGAPVLTCDDDPEAPFDCGPKDFCLSLNGVCDGEVDCDSGLDEIDCTFECGSDEYQCPVERECIPLDYLCDGEYYDCSQGEDESAELCEPACSDTQATCGDGECIEEGDICDGFDDCSEGEDEAEELCGSAEICDSGVTFEGYSDSLNLCLGSNCCFEFEYCTADGEDIEGCQDCFANGGGDICDWAISCGFAYCGLE